ncbi:hypothetical protein Mal52_20080 [Symmachiella dynata]|uniref:Uncharacterized protein n=1 Tax=Symmachiella dynata TaxID=2527995 RepID=A0A517ZM35_9PLAN|nr:hypothetical protein [Symmachiella dynata]QDU43532.1 hypothetical protein Mal52_20080 [Symmachiella dynata]
MKKLFVLFAVVAMSFAQIGCGGPATEEATPPAADTGAAAGDEAVEVDETVVEEPAAEESAEDAEAEN